MKNALLLLVMASVFAGCGGEFSKREVGDLFVTFSHEPNPAHVGENSLRVRITDRGGKPIAPSEVLFHYYPFVFRVKDAPADPEEVVRVTDALAGADGYTAKATFEKPGPWKITVKIVRPEKPDTLATFTVEVQGKTG